MAERKPFTHSVFIYPPFMGVAIIGSIHQGSSLPFEFDENDVELPVAVIKITNIKKKPC